MSRHFRQRQDDEQRATSLELFFDLVFVFAVTQLSHYLLVHYTWKGALQAGVLLLVVWWAWIYTTWMANWFDPDVVPVRLVLVAVMLGSLLMSAGSRPRSPTTGCCSRAATSACSWCATRSP